MKNRDMLVVVDFQNDFINGVLGSPEAQMLIGPVRACIEDFKNRNGIIVATKDWHSDIDYKFPTIEESTLPKHCVAGTNGAELHPFVKDLIYEGNVFCKTTFGATWDDEDLDEIKHIYIIGLCTDICVISNALNLRSTFPATPITVYSNLCAGSTPSNHEAALKVMRSCLINVEDYKMA